MRGARQAQLAWFAIALQPRCDIDAVAHEVAIRLLDDVAEMNANTALDALVSRDACVALDHAGLHLDGAAHGVDHAAELDNAPSPVRLTTRPL